MKAAIVVAVLFLLGSFHAPVRADGVVGVTFTDTVYGGGQEESMWGSLNWDIAGGTISDITTQESGSLFTLEIMTEGPRGFVWNFYDKGGEYSIEFLVEGDSIAPIGINSYVNKVFYGQYFAVALVNPLPAMNAPEPSSLFLLGIGLALAAGFAAFRK